MLGGMIPGNGKRPGSPAGGMPGNRPAGGKIPGGNPGMNGGTPAIGMTCCGSSLEGVLGSSIMKKSYHETIIRYRGFAQIVKLRKFAAMMEENIRIVRIV